MRDDTSCSLNVTFLYGAYPPIPDGGADALRNLCIALVGLGIKVSVVTTSTVASLHPETQGVIVYPVIDNWSLSVASFKKLRATLRITKPDVVHTIFPSATFGHTYHLPMLIKLALPKVPLVTTLYGFALRTGSLGNRLCIIALLHGSSRLCSDNDFVIRFINRFLPYLRRRVRYLPSGSNISKVPYDIASRSELRARYGLEPSSFYVCHFGYLAIDRGIEILFRAIHEVRDRGYDVRVIMIGGKGSQDNSVYFAELSMICDQLELGHHITWTGFCDHDKVGHYFKCANAAVLPFIKNTLGRSSLPAALSFGLPVITTSITSELFSLRDHENVLLVPPGDIIRLADAIQELIDNPELCHRLEVEALRLWESDFSWGVIAGRAATVYSEVVKGRARA